MILSLTTKDELNRLIKDYYLGIPVSVLVKRYKLDIPSNKLINHLPPIVAQNKCQRCDINFLAKRPARQSKEKLIFSCPVCSQQLEDSDAVLISNDSVSEIPEFKLSFFTSIMLKSYGSGMNCIHMTPLNDISSDYLMSVESVVRTKLSLSNIIDENWRKLSLEGRPVPLNLPPDVVVALRNLQWLDVRKKDVREKLVTAWVEWSLVDCLDYFYRLVRKHYPLGAHSLTKEDMEKLKARLNLISPVELRISMYRGIMVGLGVNERSRLMPNKFLGLVVKQTLKHEPKDPEKYEHKGEISPAIMIISEVSDISPEYLYNINGMILSHQLEAKAAAMEGFQL